MNIPASYSRIERLFYQKGYRDARAKKLPIDCVRFGAVAALAYLCGGIDGSLD